MTGFVFDYLNDSIAAVFIATWNIVSVVLEYGLLTLIYKEFPKLSHKEKVHEDKDDDLKVGCCAKIGRKLKVVT